MVFPISVAAADAGQPVDLALKLNYAVCEKLCLPAKAELKLTLPQAGASPYAATLAAAAAEVPRPADLAGLGGALTTASADAWRFCANDEAGPPRDLFIEAPEGWWLATKPQAADAGHACFTLSLQQKPDGARLPIEVRATLTGGAGPRVFPLALSAKS